MGIKAKENTNMENVCFSSFIFLGQVWEVLCNAFLKIFQPKYSQTVKLTDAIGFSWLLKRSFLFAIRSETLFGFNIA